MFSNSLHLQLALLSILYTTRAFIFHFTTCNFWCTTVWEMKIFLFINTFDMYSQGVCMQKCLTIYTHMFKTTRSPPATQAISPLIFRIGIQRGSLYINNSNVPTYLLTLWWRFNIWRGVPIHGDILVSKWVNMSSLICDTDIPSHNSGNILCASVPQGYTSKDAGWKIDQILVKRSFFNVWPCLN